ncbi:MAG TPA: DivIVA domain-containing protein [Myxococcota bacterium]|nr:DivIVA domain-containing protein [Myxococcota bacterium]
MRITPLDIRNHTFSRRVSGYDRDEVDSFLRMVSEDYETALRHAAAMKDKIRELEERVRELSANETLLQSTLTTAQQLADDLKQTAMKEAEVIVGEAELQGEKVLDAAHRRAAQLAEDIRGMRRLRADLSAALRATIERHLAQVDHLSAEPVPEDAALEQRISVLTHSHRRRTP